MKPSNLPLIVGVAVVLLVVFVGFGALKTRARKTEEAVKKQKEEADKKVEMKEMVKQEQLVSPAPVSVVKEPEKPPLVAAVKPEFPKRGEGREERVLWREMGGERPDKTSPKVARDQYGAVYKAGQFKTEYLRELAKLHDRFAKDDRHDCQLYGRSDPGRIYRNTQRNLLYNEWFQYYRMRLAAEVAGSVVNLSEPPPPGSIVVPPKTFLRGDWVDSSWAPKKK